MPRRGMVHGAYRRHAQQIGRRIGMPGQPIQTRLGSFGTVRGMAGRPEAPPLRGERF